MGWPKKQETRVSHNRQVKRNRAGHMQIIREVANSKCETTRDGETGGFFCDPRHFDFPVCETETSNYFGHERELLGIFKFEHLCIKIATARHHRLDIEPTRRT